ncbi:MAG: hypothetical protein GX587_07635 [Bacteroidales bacterium]|nr:hypothetical protein [Bacteroidales bacterium]
MKRLLLGLSLSLLLSGSAYAQNKKMLNLQISTKRIEFRYQQQFLFEKLWAGFYTGIANLDINNKFDDVVTGLELGMNVYSNQKDQIDVYSSLGICSPNNNYYAGIAPEINIVARYAHVFGKTKKHLLIINTGFRYLKKDYKQAYASETIKVSTTGSFIATPFFISIGYGFGFK